MTIIENSTANQPMHSRMAVPAHDTTAQVIAIRPGVELPKRFDVHQVEAVLTDLRSHAADGTTVDIDGSLVEMIDLAALRSLESAVADQSIRIIEPSVALRMTAEYTGHHLVASSFTSRHDLDEAA